jgi:hypothetical protein
MCSLREPVVIHFAKDATAKAKAALATQPRRSSVGDAYDATLTASRLSRIHRGAALAVNLDAMSLRRKIEIQIGFDSEARSSEANLEHDPEKWEPVFG